MFESNEANNGHLRHRQWTCRRRAGGWVGVGWTTRPSWGTRGKPAVPGAASTERAGVLDLTGFRHRLTAMTPWCTPTDPEGPEIGRAHV